MKLLKITGHVFVAVDDEVDPEGVAQDFSGGFRMAVRGFPGGEVTGAEVALIEEASEEERATHLEEAPDG